MMVLERSELAREFCTRLAFQVQNGPQGHISGKSAVTLQSMLSISEAQIARLLECRQRIINSAKRILVTVDIKVANSMMDELINVSHSLGHM
jgi:hypothetical protein